MRDLDILTILRESLLGLRACALPLLNLALPLVLLPEVVVNLVLPKLGFADGDYLFAQILLEICVMLFGVFTLGLFHAYSTGGQPGFSALRATVAPHAGTLIALSFVIFIGVLFGSLMLVVPGVFVAIITLVAPPAALFEKLSIVDALKRSHALTQRRRLALLGLVLLTSGLVLAILVLGLMAYQAAGMPLNKPPERGLAAALIDSVVTISAIGLSYAVATRTYLVLVTLPPRA